MKKRTNQRIKINRHGFVFDVFINETKRCVVAVLKTFPEVQANISMGSFRLLDMEGYNNKKNITKTTNVVKICGVPMFTKLPRIESMAKCHHDDEWVKSKGIELAVNRVYKKAHRHIKNAIMRTVGTPS